MPAQIESQGQFQLQNILLSAEKLGVEMDEMAAMKWLGAMEAYQNDHSVVADTETGIFGHRVAMLDFSPQQLTRFREIGELVEFKDIPGKVESALALSGSAAQNKVQTYPGDCDFFERINILASSHDEACQILNDIMRTKALTTFAGDTYQFVEMKYGNYPETVFRNGNEMRKGSPISWLPSDVKQGYLVVYDEAERPKLIRWEDVMLDPGWCKIDWVILDPERGQLAFASNMLDITWESPTGEIVPLDGYLDAYFQEVYLDADSHPLFMKLVKNVSADMLHDYVGEMEKQIKKYTILGSKGTNYGKAAKRMYNVFRLTGRYEEAAYLRELFDEPAALLYQVNSLLKTIEEAAMPNSSISLDDLLAQADDLIMDVIKVLEGAAEIEIVRYLLRLEHALCRQEKFGTLGDEIDAASAEVINIVNNFFYNRMNSLPTIKSYIDGLHL